MAIVTYHLLGTFFFLQAGIITFSTSIIKGGVEKFALKQPIFLVCSILSCVVSVIKEFQNILALSDRSIVFF